MTNFQRDLQIGQKLEDNFRDQYKDQYRITQTVGKVKTHDGTIFFEDGPLKYECKLDQQAHTTGNFAIEVYRKYRENPDKIIPAGVSATGADFFVLGFKNINGVYAITTEKMNKLIKDKKYKRLVDYTGDRKDGVNDGCATIALFDLNWFLSQCELLYTN